MIDVDFLLVVSLHLFKCNKETTYEKKIIIIRSRKLKQS